MSFLISAGKIPKRGDCSCWLHLEMFSGEGSMSMASDFFVRVSMSRQLEVDSVDAMVVFGGSDWCANTMYATAISEWASV